MPASATCDHLEHLGAGLYELLQDGRFTDVTFAVGEREYNAHRHVLCAASPYFRKMLSTCFAEASARAPIAITDFSQEAFSAFLSFAYTGSIETLSPNNACEILLAADKVCMDTMVRYIIQYLVGGHLTCTNCCVVMLAASELGGHGRQPPWLALFSECASFIAGHIVEILDLPTATSAFVGLDLASVCAILDTVTQQLCTHPALLQKVWLLVSRWGARALGAIDYGSMLGILSAMPFAELDFLEATCMSVTLDPFGNNSCEWRSGKEAISGYDYHLRVVKGAGQSGESTPDEGYYGMFIVAKSKYDGPDRLGLFVSAEFTCSQASAPSQQHCLGRISNYFLPVKGFRGLPCWGWRNMVRESDLLMRAGAAHGDRSVTVEAVVKVNPLLGLITEAASLNFCSSPQHILETFPPEILCCMLQSEDVGIVSEASLLDELVTYGDGLHRLTVDREKFERLIPALRLEHTDFFQLLNAAKESPALQCSTCFAGMLKETFERLGRPAEVGQSARKRRGGPRQPPGEGGRSAACQEQEPPPSAIPSVEGLVQWFRHPSRQLLEMGRSMDEARRADLFLVVETAIQRHAPGDDPIRVSGLAHHVLRRLPRLDLEVTQGELTGEHLFQVLSTARELDADFFLPRCPPLGGAEVCSDEGSKVGGEQT